MFKHQYEMLLLLALLNSNNIPIQTGVGVAGMNVYNSIMLHHAASTLKIPHVIECCFHVLCNGAFCLEVLYQLTIVGPVHMYIHTAGIGFSLWG